MAKVADSVGEQSQPVWLPVLLALLFAAVTASALAVAYVSFENRQLFMQLQRLETEQQHLQTRLGQLLLEESAWSSPALIEQLAAEEIGMSVPQPADIIVSGALERALVEYDALAAGTTVEVGR